MSISPQILAFAGSARTGSFNKMLVNVAAAGARQAGAAVTVVDLSDYPMPLYDQDLFDAEGFPESVLAFKTLMKSHQGFLIACPEYNSSITPLLKNTIDWASRAEPGEAPLALTCFKGKFAALMSTSPGGLGGLRGLGHVRSILESIGTFVIPDQVAVPGAMGAFTDDGNSVDETQQTAIQGLGHTLTDLLSKLM